MAEPQKALMLWAEAMSHCRPPFHPFKGSSRSGSATSAASARQLQASYLSWLTNPLKAPLALQEEKA
ncbi:hypothetical protein GcC1_047007 [Golovinomyces cichoracearum]|uniref:Uncharacterized protein n=1 Tax=Golovinomyces cichoracearum TaxID=62708 RepID=A0A420IXM9_9PEZI|nr:hypothetical protein GcC1_047007 [Golovinomyces cichoracearum]